MFTHGRGPAPEIRHPLHSHHQPHAKDVQRQVSQVQTERSVKQVRQLTIHIRKCYTI